MISETARPIVEVARRLGVKIRANPAPYNKPSMHATYGPRGHWCDVEEKIVYLNDPPAGYADLVEVYLHEVVHCVVQVPWLDIDVVPEDFILMQFERQLARTILDAAGLRRVIRWQRATEASIVSREYGFSCGKLSDYDDYHRSRGWKNGFWVLRLLGALDEKNRVTFRKPDWNKARPYKQAFSDYIAGMSECL